MKIAELFLGTVLTVLFVIQSIRGERYEEWIKNLEGTEYPMKELYGVGYCWCQGKMFPLKGKLKEDLISQAKILYDSRYAEYYATLAYAQAATFVHLMLCFGFLLAGVFDSFLFAAIGIAAAVAFGMFSLKQMKDKVETRQLDCTVELPEVVSTMALLINAGMTLREAWERIAYTKDGTIYRLMQNACVEMQNGMSEPDAIYHFSIQSNSPEIKKFASSLTQGIEKGSSDLSLFLNNQSSEMWNLKRQLMLQKGEAAATKLLIPTVLIFGGILIIVASAAIGMIL